MYHREFTEARVKEPEPRDETDALTDGEEERCFRQQVLLRGCGQWYRCGRDRVARPSEQENLDPQPQRNRRRQEDVSKGEPSRGQTGLHSRSSDLTSELNSRRALKAETRAQTNDEIMPAWCRQTGD